MTAFRYKLSHNDKVIIKNGSKLKDIHIDKFHSILKICSLKKQLNFQPRDTLAIQKIVNNPHQQWIQPVLQNKEHLQILHSCNDNCKKCVSGHWVCCHYDTKFVRIFDSLNQNDLHPCIEMYLKQLFPYFIKNEKFDRDILIIENVQNQKNGDDCGVFAIAFATSVFFNKNPSTTTYIQEHMRNHLYKMFEDDELVHFPSVTNGDESLNLSIQYPDYSCIKPLGIFPESHNLHTTEIIYPSTISSKIKWQLIGLPNPDQVSCYANSTVQSLFNCSSIRDALGKSNQNALTKVFNEYKLKYINNNVPVDIYNLRKFVNHVYAENRQQDVPEFIAYLCDKLEIVKLVIQHELQTTLLCPGCDRSKILNPYHNIIFPLSVCFDKLTCTLQDLIDKNLDSNPSDIDCNFGCGSTSKFRETLDLITNNQIIVMQTKLFYLSGTTVKKVNNFILKDVLAYVTIKNQQYKIISLIVHQGYSNVAGHYINYIRQGDEWWITNDDKVTKISSPTNVQDAYVIFLQKNEHDELLTQAPPTVASNYVKLHRIEEMSDCINKYDDCRKRKLYSTSDYQIYPMKYRRLDIMTGNLSEYDVTTKDGSNCDKGSIQTCDEMKPSDVSGLARNKRKKINDQDPENSLEHCVKRSKILTNQTSHKDIFSNDEHTTCSADAVQSVSSTDVKIKLIKNKRKSYYQEYYRKNKEKLRQKRILRQNSKKSDSKTRAADKKTDKNEKNRIYYINNKNKVLEHRKNHYEKNKEKLSDCRKKFYQRNKEQVLEYARNYYALNKEDKLIKCKHRRALNIRKKYFVINVKHATRKLLQVKHNWVKKIMPLMSTLTVTEAKIKAEHLITRVISARDRFLSDAKGTLKKLKDKVTVGLSRLGDTVITNVNINNAISGLCGTSMHSSHSEPYFSEAVYDFGNGILSNDSGKMNVIVLNESGQSTNVIPLLEGTKKMNSWLCTQYCKMPDVHTVQEFKNFFNQIIDLNYGDVDDFLKKIDTCSAESGNPEKLGHPIVCHIGIFLCSSTFLKLRTISCHFPFLRTITDIIYKLRKCVSNIEEVNQALNNGDLDELNNIALKAGTSSLVFELKNASDEVSLDENQILNKFSSGVKIYYNILNDLPLNACVSCERLCCNKSVVDVKKYEPNVACELLEIRNTAWERLLQYYTENDLMTIFNEGKICKTCLEKLKKNTIPPTCILNNLYFKPIPDELKSLNMYEKILIQRAKAFQVIQKKGTVMKKNLPHYARQDKLVGKVFHLPLPLDETLKKLCKETDPLNTDHELYILVRSIPTKGKVIWEDYVDVKKVWNALKWLKINNPIYSKINIPTNPEDLLNDLKNTSLEYVEENLDKNDEITKDEAKVNNLKLPQPEALLTGKSQSDIFYDEFTIQALNVKKPKESDTKLYQMKKVYETPMAYNEKDLDLKCFPDVYPYGECGQRVEREIRLRDSDFIKHILTSKHPQFRNNKQLLFYYLHDSNMRNINAGIYHMLHILDTRYKYTAGNYMKQLDEHILESNLRSIFARLRGTEAYWRRPRRELNCMAQEYGPITFFVTLSPAEWNWPDLGEFIRDYQSLDNDSRSDGQLVVDCPVPAAIFIENKFKAVMGYLLSDAKPIGKIEHYYYVREYQGRGLPHFHCVFWIKDAPVYGISSNEDVKKFILQYITCHIPNKYTSPDLYRRVMEYQQHKHNDYCMRKSKTKSGFISVCRFEFPRKITKEFILRTVIAAITNRRKLKNNSKLYDLPRNFNERYTNDFMPAVLALWEGNTDAQFIGESSFLLTYYVTCYGTKSEKSNVDLTELALNKSLCSRLWTVGIRGLTHRECGAIEAADTLLAHPLHGTDPKTTFLWVDVGFEKRRKLKSYDQVKQLPSDSTDIFCDNLVDTYYPMRPKELENICLYDFARFFDIWKKEPIRKAEYYKMDENLYCRKRKEARLILHMNYNPQTQPEAYYYSILILFKPWRKNEELKGNQDTYQNAFIEMKDQLSTALKYHDKLQMIQRAMDEANKLIEQEVLAKTLTQKSEHQEIADPLDALQVIKDVQDILEKVCDKKNESDLDQSVNNFNDDQLRIFNTITSTISSENKIVRLFISGFGGTGKSYLIENLVLWNKLKRNKNTAVAAPTGIAAYNIQGLTIHRLLQLPVEHGGTAKYKPLSDTALKRIRQSFKDVDFIIIDEISMVSNITLMYIHLRLAEIFGTSDTEDGWFGKIHMVVFGDLLQLPPVREDFPFIALTKSQIDKYIRGMLTFNLWTLFDYDELTINMRQKNDQLYSEILGKIRLGYLSNSDIDTLQKRRIQFSSDIPSSSLQELCEYLKVLPNNTVCLMPTKDMCAILNNTMLNNLESEEVKLIANDCYKCPKRLEKRVLKILNEDDENACGISRVITIKIGCKIMIRRNIDVSIGLVNGTIATVIAVNKGKTSIDSVTIKLQSNQEYSIKRLEYQFQIMDQVYITREQFPFCLSYAITIHKSQGLSLENAVVEAGNNIFSCGQTYVALSRITKLEGLHLINFDPSSIKADESAIIEYNRLRKHHRPDLDMYTMQHSDPYKQNKIFDSVWSVSRHTLQIQANTINSVLERPLNDFIQIISDKNSLSYAKACIQSLFHCQLIRKSCLECRNEDTLIQIFNRYITKVLVDLIPLSNFLNPTKYSCTTQQDAADYLLDICTTFETIGKVTEHQLTVGTRCPGCDFRPDPTTTRNYILTVCLNSETNGAYTLQRILDENINIWRDMQECCINHCKYKKQEKISLCIGLEKILIIKLAIFSNKNKLTGFKINEVPKTKLILDDKCFKVINAIFHSGRDLDHGKYFNVLREETDWFHVHDSNISKKPWPKGSKDIYIIFLEQCKAPKKKN